MIKKVCSLNALKRIIADDPVRPGISAEDRIGPARDVFHWNNKAYICMAYLDVIPPTEKSLLTIECGPIAVAYTIWSLEKGRGRDLILAVRDMISESFRFERLVTLSPKTDMAMKFHLSNGAILVHENETTNNFEYKI